MIRTAFLASLVSLATLAAQEPPGPAPELKKLDMLVGAFTGEGSVRGAADMEAMAWTARSVGQRVLGGHAIEERMTVEFQGGAIPPITFRSFFAWDREAGRYVNLGVSNMGPVELQPVHLVGDRKFVIMASHRDESGPVLDHGAYEFGKDGYQFVMQRIGADGKPFVHVSGAFKRDTTEPAAVATEAGFHGEPAGELARLAKMLGKWTLTGKMTPAPGAPEIPISGVETEALGFGGNVIVGHVLGDPIPGMGPAYEAWGFTTWDPHAQCYVYGHINNMGEVGLVHGHALDADKTVWITAQKQMGTPTARRAILDLSGGGMRWTSESLTGGSPAARDFEATYKRAR